MEFTLTPPDMKTAVRGTEEDLARILTSSMRQVTRGFIEDLRDDTIAGGLGQRVANAWRGKTYPEGGRTSLEPASYVWTNAPRIIESHRRDHVIHPTNGRRYMAIPTDNARKGRGAMTVREVQDRYGKLQWRPNPNRPGSWLGFAAVLASKTAKKGFRRATARVRARGPNARLVLMFTFVRSVRMRQLIRPDEMFHSWADRVEPTIAANWR